MFGWNLEVVDKSKGTVQFKDECTIKDSEEMDLFGYMKTSKKSDDKAGGSSIRSAAVRLSNAISLEDYKSDMDFLNNKGLADRINEFPNLANVEQHLSYYTYTVTIDLEKIGKDGEIELDNEVKMKRVIELLEILKVLNSEIRGRGVYNLNSPYFLGRIELKNVKQKFAINTNILEDTMKLKIGENEISQDTNIGIVKDIFENEKEIEEKFANKVSNIQDFFEKLEDSVKQYYK